jgi:hypothetical protein
MTEGTPHTQKPVATIYRVQHSGTCQDCGRADVTVIEADIGQSAWMLICLDCLAERLHEMQERLGADGSFHRFGEPGGEAVGE